MVKVDDARHVVSNEPFSVLCGELVDRFVDEFPDLKLKITLMDGGICVFADENEENYVTVSLDGAVVRISNTVPSFEHDPSKKSDVFKFDLVDPDSCGAVLLKFAVVCRELANVSERLSQE